MEISAAWMRGGTSKCWIFESKDLDQAPVGRDELLLRAYGSPDIRQLDGVGGGTSTTSKAVILESSQDADYDVSYTFAQIGIDEAVVDWSSNCGNCSATAGVYAIEQGWIQPTGDMTEVRVMNLNTHQLIVQQISTPGGNLPTHPQATMPGVIYPGHSVRVGFEAPEGKTTGALFPDAGARTSAIEVDGGTYRATLVDAGAPSVFIDAADFNLVGKPQQDWEVVTDQNLSRLDAIRRQAAVRMGLAKSPSEAARAIPKIGIVGPSETSHIKVQMLSMGQRHPAMPITGSVALTLASRTPGTVNASYSKEISGEELEIETPSGILTTFATTSKTNQLVVGTERTCRTIARATLFVPEATPTMEMEAAS